MNFCLRGLRGRGSIHCAVNNPQGQSKAAAVLQRDWRRGEDPDKLPFAIGIQRRDLVRLVHKGLLYYDHEQAVRQKQVCDPPSMGSLTQVSNGLVECTS